MRILMFSAALAVLSLPMLPALAQEPAKDSVNSDEIIRKFAAKEAEFRAARNNYTYRQTVKMEELEPAGGKWEEIDDIIFNPQGKRSEVVVWAPVISLKNINLTPEDTQDLRDVQPFVLTSDDIGLYNVNYLGREKLDEIGCFTFSVKPKKMEKGKRYFEGQIWVDDRDMQIVKTFGKGVVQSLYNLPDRGALKITTARYVTPNGRDIQHKGIVPDVVLDQRVDLPIIDTPADKQLAQAKAILRQKDQQ